ncbi:MAG: SBBP repeat-containing protein, partial [Candidatus Zixiibacteriota bacterium]
MARLHVFVALSVLILTSAVSSGQLQSAITNDLASVPLAFTENQGQWDEQVLFRSNAGGATMWFTTDGAFYQFTRHVRASECGPFNPLSMMELDSVETVMIKASFVGADPEPSIRGENPLGYKCNYFIGDDQARWRTNVTNYSAVVYEDLYPGIDLKYYGNGREMEYDFIVSPGGDPSKVVIEYDGAESVFVNEVGELVVQTEWGQVIERTPVVYQLRDGERVALDGQYRLVGEKCFGFCLDSDYDPILAVVIDPVLSFGTYLGGSGDDYGYGITVDASGAIYVTGETYSTDFPVLDAYQSDQGGSDVFVTKFSATDNSLVFSTYLGGSNQDVGIDIAVSTAGEVYLTGITASFNFPMVDPYQASKVGSALDGFVAKLSSDGGSLLYSTYLGGDARDDAYHIVVDETGAMYIAGFTASSNFPTFNPFQTDQGGDDAFVTKLSSGGNSLVYSTYLGGSGQEGAAHGLAVDASGAAYVVGFTYSTDFPTLDAYQNANNGAPDAFVSKLSSAGNSLVYSTYLGGSLADYGYGIAVDASGEAYVTGTTFSTDFPTAVPYQTHQGSADAFITKFNSAGNDLAYSTYLGGSSDEQPYSITVDDSGSAYVIAYTYSTDFPTFNPYQGAYHGGVDAAVVRMNVSGSSPVFSTYLGGSDRDMPRDIAIDTTGAVYVTGETISTDFPTHNPYQDSLAGNNDGFVIKLSSGEIEFSEPVDYVVGLYPSSVYSGDLDGDGDKDL